MRKKTIKLIQIGEVSKMRKVEKTLNFIMEVSCSQGAKYFFESLFLDSLFKNRFLF